MATKVAPELDLILGYREIWDLERNRCMIKVDDNTEPLAYVFRALGLGIEVLAKAVGL